MEISQAPSRSSQIAEHRVLLTGCQPCLPLEGNRRVTMANQNQQDNDQRRDQQGSGRDQRDRQQQQENRQDQMGDERRQDQAPGNRQQR